MFNFRVSKYDPQLRDEFGAFVGDEWTSVFDDVSIEEFKEIEGRYVQCAISLMKMCNISRLKAIEIEDHFDAAVYPECLEKETRYYHECFSENESKTFDQCELEKIIRLALREAVWFKLTGEHGFYLHFGYDLYLYIGADMEVPLDSGVMLGLYIERELISPYI